MPIPLERLAQARDAKVEADELRRLRQGFGLTQIQVAQLLDVGPATYQRYERGVNLCPLAVLELLRCWSREGSGTTEATGKRGAGKKKR